MTFTLSLQKSKIEYICHNPGLNVQCESFDVCLNDAMNLQFRTFKKSEETYISQVLCNKYLPESLYKV